MSNGFLAAAIALFAVIFFSTFGRQLRRYNEGERSYLSYLEGRYFAGIAVMVLLSASASLLMTVLQNGSVEMFLVIFGCFLIFSIIVISVLTIRARKG
jgi:hypothetical protein